MRFAVAAYFATLVTLVICAVVGGAIVLNASGPSDPLESTAERYSHNLLQWELSHAPEKWLYKIGGFLSGRDSPDEEAALRRYFELTARMARLEGQDPGPPELARMEEERAGLENEVEAIIEGRATAILEEQGLTMGPPPFTEMDLVFPPFDFEFDQPPRVLVTSPRDKIELTHNYLLRPGISPDQIAGIEAEAEEEPNTSALVAGTGGVSTYPSVEDNLDSYERLMEIVFHEWTHSYLLFYPLGSRYFESSELRTLNETVATVAGEQLASAYFEKYGRLEDETNEASPSPEPSPEAGAFDFVAEMRALRRQVESMLAEGEVDEAEGLMEAKRVEFSEKGYRIRKLNQAYFAFHGFYGTGAGSIDPIGPKVEQLLAAAKTPGEFLRQARVLTSQAALDALLSRLGSG